jgi:hyperosmotically inducible periplasmic protein
MRVQVLGWCLSAMLLAGAGVAGASTNPTNSDLSKRVMHEIRMYPRYTIWDDISFRVASNGQVELFGAVNQPYKKSDIEHIVRRIPGVTSVTDEIKVLPLSSFDDRLRLQVARAIFRDPVLSRYSMGAIPSIHIIVDNGHVTLAGVVDDEMSKNLAGMRAAGAGLSFGSITNNLQVEHTSKKS